MEERVVGGGYRSSQVSIYGLAGCWRVAPREFVGLADQPLRFDWPLHGASDLEERRDFSGEFVVFLGLIAVR